MVEQGKAQITRKLTEGISFSYFGLGFNKAWVFLAMPSFGISFSRIDGIEGDLTLQFVYDGFFILAAFAIALVSLKVAPASLRRVSLPLSTGAMTASSILMLAAHLAPAGVALPLMFASAVLGAIGVMGMAALWADFYAAFNPLRSALLNAGAVIVMSLVCYATAESTFPRMDVLLIILSLLSCLCLVLSTQRTSEKETRDSRKPCRIVFPYKAAAFIAAYSFAYGMASSLTGGGPHLPLLRAVPAVIIVALALLNARRFNIKVLYNIAFPLMVCGLLLVAMVPGLPSALPPAVLEISYSTMGIMVILIACSISYSLGASASWLFCILVAIQFVARAAGMMLRGALEPALGTEAFSQCVSIAGTVLVVVASIAMLSEKSIFSHWGAARVDADNPLALPRHVQLRVDTLASACSLTQREKEVLHLMALKRTTAQMADEMFIAEGTVKAHVQHIYQKLGVHTRKELQALIGVDKDQ